jgi:hypothetical protein
MDVIGQFHAPVTLRPGKESPLLIVKEAGWILEPVWTRSGREKFPLLSPPGIDLLPSSPQPSLYTAWAIPDAPL